MGKQFAGHGAHALGGLPPLFIDLAGRLDVEGAELDDLHERHASSPIVQRQLGEPAVPAVTDTAPSRGCPLLTTGRFPRTGTWRATHRERGHRLATPADGAAPCAGGRPLLG